MKKIITLSIFMFAFLSFCYADGLPISDVIKEAREESSLAETVKTNSNKKQVTTLNPEITKQDVKNNVTSTLNDLEKTN